MTCNDNFKRELYRWGVKLPVVIGQLSKVQENKDYKPPFLYSIKCIQTDDLKSHRSA